MRGKSKEQRGKRRTSNANASEKRANPESEVVCTRRAELTCSRFALTFSLLPLSSPNATSVVSFSPQRVYGPPHSDFREVAFGWPVPPLRTD